MSGRAMKIKGQIQRRVDCQLYNDSISATAINFLNATAFKAQLGRHNTNIYAFLRIALLTNWSMNRRAWSSGYETDVKNPLDPRHGPPVILHRTHADLRAE
jgi:hypothetical protein